MADTFICINRLGVLAPIDEPGRQAVAKVGHGKQVLVTVKKARNPYHHRKLFAMLGIVLANQNHYKDVDQLLGACKLATGHCDLVKTKHGVVGLPKSIAFHALDQIAFAGFYDKAVQWVVEEVIPGLSARDLNAEVEEELRRFAA